MTPAGWRVDPDMYWQIRYVRGVFVLGSGYGSGIEIQQVDLHDHWRGCAGLRLDVLAYGVCDGRRSQNDDPGPVLLVVKVGDRSVLALQASMLA